MVSGDYIIFHKNQELTKKILPSIKSTGYATRFELIKIWKELLLQNLHRLSVKDLYFKIYGRGKYLYNL